MAALAFCLGFSGSEKEAMSMACLWLPQTQQGWPGEKLNLLLCVLEAENKKHVQWHALAPDSAGLGKKLKIACSGALFTEWVAEN
eukprot:gene5717-19001_t